MNITFRRRLVISFILIGISLPLLCLQNKKNLKVLPDQFRKWLTEEVVYIISPKEKDVFLKLDTDREREVFIDAFWKQRDPTPNTPKNEYREEHYRRIAYANRWYGRESPAPGWRSEMGRVYIILGPPKQEEKFENNTEVFPTIIWFYEGMDKFGLPNAFNVVFFKEGPIGEYKLYSPVKYGPQQLLTNWTGDAKDYNTAYGQLLEVSPSLAEVSMTLIPGEIATLQSVSIASDILINAKIPAAGYEGVKDGYADKLLKYKDRVDVDYTANYIDSDSLLNVIRHPSGVFYVHYLIEPAKLSVEEYQGKYQTWLEINGTVSDAEGTVIHQVENRIPLEFNEEQINQIKDRLFSYQDMFPLVPGAYNFSCLMKNSVSKEFTSMETKIIIPESTAPQTGSLLLANKTIKNPKNKSKNKPYQVGETQLVPSPRNDFTSDDTLVLFFQIYGLTDDLRKNGRVEYAVTRENEKKISREKALADYAEAPDIIEEFKLSGLTPGYYIITATLVDQSNKSLSSSQTQFVLSTLPRLSRPWILSLSQPAPDDPFYVHMMGKQYLNKNNLTKANALLGEAYHKNPRNAKYALDFGRAIFLDKDYARTIEIANPFAQGPDKFDFTEILGQSHQALGRYAEAIPYYKDYLAHFGTNLNILNAIGECYLQLGDEKEALIAWERSLQINPKQDDLAKKVKRIKEKK